MLEVAQNAELRAYAGGAIEEPFPSVHVSLARPEEESRDLRLDAITVLALLIVNSGLIMEVVTGGAARFEGYPGAAESVLAVLWSLQAVIAFLFFVVVARWLRS
ncbi:MAG TPA: hypothetical protein VNS63_17305 [Blastocatellia bacterium]|nr:hypothetical protein [Blastocatellia bacterium]